MKLPQNHLTAEQEKLWEKTLKELTILYEKLQLTPKPMPMDTVKAIRIPSNIAEEATMPLPWDVQLLLSFDQTLTLAPDDNEFALLSDASKGIVCSADVLIELLSDISGESCRENSGKIIPFLRGSMLDTCRLCDSIPIEICFGRQGRRPGIQWNGGVAWH